MVVLYKLRHLGAPIEADAASVGLPADAVHDDCAKEHFQSDDATIDAMYAAYRAAQGLFGLDCLGVALGESLRRRGKGSAAKELIDEYLKTGRRDGLRMSESLAELRMLCS